MIDPSVRRSINRFVVVAAATILGSAWPIPGGELMAQGVRTLPKGAVIYDSLGFEDPRSLEGWAGPAHVGGPGLRSARCLQFRIDASTANPFQVINRLLPVERLRGCTIILAAQVKATNVAEAKVAGQGVALSLLFKSNAYGLNPRQAVVETGSFDWKLVSVVVAVPRDAEDLRANLGLVRTQGLVEFDDVRILVRTGSIDNAPPPPSVSLGPTHGVPRLRGVNVGPILQEPGLKYLGETWKANLIRCELSYRGQPGYRPNWAEYERNLEESLQLTDQVLEHCKKYGIVVVIDLHSAFGGDCGSDGEMMNNRLFASREIQDRLVDVWLKIAKRYHNSEVIWGYDLANEPQNVNVDPDTDDWPTLALRVGKVIREVDPNHALIVESIQEGGPASLGFLPPIPLRDVVYSFHMYWPLAFTYQGLPGFGGTFEYPGVVKGREWNRVELEKSLQPVLDYQKKFGVPLFVGEFSCIRWAPNDGAYRYLLHVIDIMEKYEWHWAYHAYRMFPGWSAELDSNKESTMPPPAPTLREQQLRHYFAKNIKPQW